MSYVERLFELRDPEYASFHSKLIPGTDPETVIGVRVPYMHKLAKAIFKEGGYEEFLKELPHNYYEENLLHGLIISQIKDYDTCVREFERFFPYMDNWAVCDLSSPKVFRTNRDRLIPKIREWVTSEEVYCCRFGIKMLMDNYLEEDFLPEYLEIPAQVRSEEYYINMMVAWFYATALAKQRDATLPYFTENRLDIWVHNKAIQKSRESFRISTEDKELLKALKRKA